MSHPAGGTPYDAEYYDAQVTGALRSARAVVPVLWDLMQPASVLDVGCGRGAWLRAFADAGVADVRGVDGAYVERDKLLISPERFSAVDLRVPEAITGQYDLALCLEVAEHLPAEVAGRLTRCLTQRAPVVFFSAALPGQTGAEHINEQWPGVWDQLFAEWGFRVVDAVRPRVHQDPRVEWWYRQNAVLYASPAGLAKWPGLAAAAREPAAPRLEWVHLSMLEFVHQRYASTRYLGSELTRRLTGAVKRRLGL